MRTAPHRGDVLVVDFDRTLADGSGHVDAATVAALRRWRAGGGIVIINTGRRAGDFLGENGPATWPAFAKEVDMVVAENGGVVIDIAKDRMHMLGDPLPRSLVDEIIATYSTTFISPYRVACVKTQDPAGPDDDPNAVSLRALVERHNRSDGTHLTVSQNLDSLMVQPEGIDKLVGLMAALRILKARGIRPGRIVGAGDATNDLPFLDGCDVSVGVEGGQRLGGRVDFTAGHIMSAGVRQVADVFRALTNMDPSYTDAEIARQLSPSRDRSAREFHRIRAPRMRQLAETALRVVLSRGVVTKDNLGLSSIGRGAPGGTSEMSA